MVVRIICCLLSLSLSVFASVEQPHHTTAFIGVPSKLDFLLSFSSYSTKHFWNSHGKKLKAFNNFDSNAVSLYAEYALNCQNSVTFNSSYEEVKESLNGRTYGFNDVELSLKHLIFADPKSALTVDTLAIIPAGDKKSSIRNGKFGGQISLLYSTYFCLFQRTGWIDFAAGYRMYQGFPSDQIRASLAVGYFFKSYVQMIATMKMIYGVGNGRSHHNLNHIACHPNYRLIKGKLEGVIRLLPWVSLSLGGFVHLWGQHVGSGGGYFVGSWIDF